MAGDGEPWRCRKHPSAQLRTGGVCPVCLRASLLRLCPDCAGERPRGCICPSTSSSAASSSLSLHPTFDDPGSGLSRGGPTGRASHHTDADPAFRRSRSAAPRRPRARSSDTADGDLAAPPPHAHGGSRTLSWIWSFSRTKKADKEGSKNLPMATSAAAVPASRLSRSMSVGVVRGVYPTDQGAPHGGGSARWKGWSRHLPIPMRSFRRTSKVIQARSPSASTEGKPPAPHLER